MGWARAGDWHTEETPLAVRDVCSVIYELRQQPGARQGGDFERFMAGSARSRKNLGAKCHEGCKQQARWGDSSEHSDQLPETKNGPMIDASYLHENQSLWADESLCRRQTCLERGA